MDGAESPVVPPDGLDRVPPRLRPLADWVLRHWLGRMLTGSLRTSRRIELFDRSMTIAAQLFTSVLPILVVLASLFGHRTGGVIADAVSLPPQTQGVLQDALDAPTDPTFGVLGALVVLVSATSLSRALTRACAALWDLPRPVSRLASAWRWVAVVLALAIALVSARQLHHVTESLAPPGLWDTLVAVAADVTVAVFVPLTLLEGVIPLRRLVPGALVFGLVMLLVRPLSQIYLPRALDSSAELYGSLGVAFTYLAWLYAVAFCLLASGVVGTVVTKDDGRLGRWIRGGRTAGRSALTP